MTSLYDEDREVIQKVGIDLNKKWMFLVGKLPDNPLHNKTARKMVELWHDEAVKRYEEAGWEVEVDITPALAGVGTPKIAVVGPMEAREFDHDKMQHEVIKSRELGGI